MSPQQSQVVIAGTLLHICAFLLTEVAGLQECLTKSRRCLNSKYMSEIFHCHVKGNFPHPKKTTFFLKCPDVDYEACLCRCKYEQMCFDVKTSACKFEFLGDIIDCSRPLALSFTELVTQVHPSVLHSSLYKNSPKSVKITNSRNTTKSSTSAQKSKEQNESNIKTLPADDYDKKQPVGKTGGLPFTEVLHEHSLVHSNPNLKPHAIHSQKTTISARQISQPLNRIIPDHPFFPTWAVALVVICVIILLVLIALLMY